ncbi:tetratricopeptide repeat protein [Gilvimarinus sp. DA14]|uniref:tetratricopeptide repeat protein n=1 Tax=Gilvimarinus sp. DA14 TaxID=2956798 RepID=UPI0020B668CC|nr:tetratricopeptide repeat protein [Gilvimarinus sp. DA14]UTF60467.1 tetratricopeptide repeat protein [Gilvimarinus sp. DA14]
MTLADFHFIRPWALLALVPLLLIAILLWFSRTRLGGWQSLIAPELLAALSDGKQKKQSRFYLVVLSLAWILACLALAGPTWERAPSQVHRQSDALVILLDLSPSMIGDDIKPSRLVRARLKIADLLQRRDQGETAMLVYADDAHVVTPLSEDTETIQSLLPVLSPGMMPVPGSRPEAGVERAIALLQDAGFDRGRLLLLTDGVASSAQRTIADLLAETPYTLSIMGIGSDEPVPIRSGQGGFLRDGQNNIVTTELGSGDLQRLAQQSGGRYITSTFDTRDVDYLSQNVSALSARHQQTDSSMDIWLDRGPWLVLILLPIALYTFRRGVILALLLVPAAGLLPTPVQAQALPDALLTPDQRGARAMQQNQPEAAAEAFTNPAWRGTAQYRAGNYEAAAESFSKVDTALGHYNRGNSLARANQLDEALKAYDEALKRDPNFADAKANKEIVEQIKQQQQEQQQQNQDGDKQQNSEQNQDQQQNQSQQNSSSGQQGEEQSEQQQSSAAPNNSQAQAGQSSSPENQNGQNQQGQSSSASSGNSQENEPQNGAAQSSSQGQAQNSSATAEGEKSEAEVRAQPTPEELEEQQAQEQWLRQIPDDPSGLLRNKFQYEYQQKRLESKLKQLNDMGNTEQRW